MSRAPKNTQAWLVENKNCEQFLFHYENEARDQVHDELADGDTLPRDVFIAPLVIHDPKAAGELRRLRSFVKKLAAFDDEQWDEPAEVLFDFVEHAKTLITPKKKGKNR